MPKAKKKTKGSETNSTKHEMDGWNVNQIKAYLRKRGGRLTGNRNELLDLAKCYSTEYQEEDPAIVAQ